MEIVASTTAIRKPLVLAVNKHFDISQHFDKYTVTYLYWHTSIKMFVCLKTHTFAGIYTTIRELSSKFDEFLAVRSQFDSDHGVDFSAPTFCQSATFMQPLFAFYCPLFFTKNNNK